MTDLRSEWEKFKQQENPEFGKLSELREGTLAERLEQRQGFHANTLLEKASKERRKP